MAVSRCSLSNGQKAGLAVSSVRSGRVGGWSFTPVRIRALAPVSGSRRHRSRAWVQAPPAARSGTLASRSRSSNSIAATRKAYGDARRPARETASRPVSADRPWRLVDRGECLLRSAGAEAPFGCAQRQGTWSTPLVLAAVARKENRFRWETAAGRAPCPRAFPRKRLASASRNCIRHVIRRACERRGRGPRPAAAARRTRTSPAERRPPNVARRTSRSASIAAGIRGTSAHNQ